jgi:hypothetical protein
MLHTPLPTPKDPLASLRRRLRRRARLDLLLAGAAVLGAGLLPADPHDGLSLALAALSIGLLLFVVRRSRDLAALASAAHAQQQALAARGISLADWQSGVPLAAWQHRG